MKTELTSIDKIKKVLNIEIDKAQIKLATETLNEGEATIEAEVFAEGEGVMIVNGDERIPLPVGEYKLDNGMILVVEEEGVIASIGEAAPEGEEEEEVAASDDKNESPLPKAVIESIVKETKFSKEQIFEAVAKENPTDQSKDIEEKDKEITELKAEILELKKDDSNEETKEEKEKREKEEAEALELKKKGINHNPEEQASKQSFKVVSNTELSVEARAMQNMANLK